MTKGINININHILKKYDQNVILDDVNLKIEPGEFVAIVGKSGCGKSTLLRIISGLESTTDGSVYFDNSKQKGLTEDTKIMFQNSRLLPWKNLIDNVKIGISKENDTKAIGALKNVGLADKKDAFPAKISGGQAQRVSLARALASSPELLLLDEPLGALDALTRVEMQNLIQKIWLKEKFTAVLVTHDVSEAVYLADRVILIQDHKIAMNKKIVDKRPRNRVSEHFVGETNEILSAIMETVLI
ncbi:MAG: ATP-binding cassette domain-containing protein [Lentilactobacillus buchneri]|jgi:sulfonate transport system ATP-binding protein|nr:ATP-binding cassette domain-containing protein [Lentilactobacillus buchneri]